ncbi:hypothetical protein H4N49_21330 [Streptomyces sp. DHE17-7]|nr:hypothetical protein [Streptomyces sp. DHE17-7]
MGDADQSIYAFRGATIRIPVEEIRKRNLLEPKYATRGSSEPPGHRANESSPKKTSGTQAAAARSPGRRDQQSTRASSSPTKMNVLNGRGERSGLASYTANAQCRVLRTRSSTRRLPKVDGGRFYERKRSGPPGNLRVLATEFDALPHLTPQLGIGAGGMMIASQSREDSFTAGRS